MILTIDKNTFLWYKGNKGLIYNSSNYKSFTFNNVKQIESILRTLKKPKSLYMANLRNDYYKDDKLNEWVNNLITIDAGKIFPDAKNAEASLLPIIKIHNDRERLLSYNDYLEMLNHVHEITFHLNGASLRQEDNKLSQQYFYPLISDRSLDYKDVLSFISRFPNTVLINFVGDFSNYPHFSELIDRLKDRRSYIILYSRIEDLALVEEKKRGILNSCNVVALCKGNQKINNSLQLIESSFENKRVDFLCSSEEDMSFVESLELKKNILKIIPFYNGNNVAFLQKYVFLNEDEILHQKLEKRKIFINQTINGFFFGKLLVLPDGSVKANANTPVIGNINKNINNMLNSLFDKDSAWFQTRDKKPCKNCIYQWLCPPVSNYELLTSVGYFCNLVH